MEHVRPITNCLAFSPAYMFGSQCGKVRHITVKPGEVACYVGAAVGESLILSGLHDSLIPQAEQPFYPYIPNNGTVCVTADPEKSFENEARKTGHWAGMNVGGHFEKLVWASTPDDPVAELTPYMRQGRAVYIDDVALIGGIDAVFSKIALLAFKYNCAVIVNCNGDYAETSRYNGTTVRELAFRALNEPEHQNTELAYPDPSYGAKAFLNGQLIYKSDPNAPLEGADQCCDCGVRAVCTGSGCCDG